MKSTCYWQEDLPATLPDVQADPVRLAQVIGNLAENADEIYPSWASGQSLQVKKKIGFG